MKISPKLAVPVFIGIFLSACNTLYNSKAINIEIFVPAKAIFPEKYNNIAIRNNNVNTAYNPNFAEYIENGKHLVDSTNIDSTVAEIYFDYFLQKLKNSAYFDSVFEIGDLIIPISYSRILF